MLRPAVTVMFRQDVFWGLDSVDARYTRTAAINTKRPVAAATREPEWSLS
jgi:hypothetical protein